MFGLCPISIEGKRTNRPKSLDEILSLEWPLRVVLAGGGPACLRILKPIIEFKTPVIILGVADPDPDAPGMALARQQGIPTYSDYRDLHLPENLHAMIDLTGRPELKAGFEQALPRGCSYFDARAASLLLQLAEARNQLSAMEKGRRENLQKLRKHQVIIDSLPYRIMVINTDMSIDTVNKTFLNDFNMVNQEVIGRKCYEVRHGYQKPCSAFGKNCHLEETLNRKQVFSRIMETRDAAGNEKYEVITVAPIINEKGEVVQQLEASRDVTDRIKLEREVQKSNTFLKNVFQSVVDGVVVVDTKGNVLLFNEGMERLTGIPAERMKGGHLTSFYSLEQARENMRRMRSDRYGPRGKLNPTSMTVRNVHGETIPVTLSASIVEIEGREIGSVGVFTDMRELDEMRKELDQAHFQLVQSEKIASVGRMAAGVAHEINNPLSIIMLHAELMEAELRDNEQAASDVREIIEQTLRCKEIVSDLLEFSRKSIGTATQFGLGWLIERCLSLLTKLASFHNIEVIREIAPDMPEMVADVGQLEQVFTNLFTNAADAMEGRGALGVKAAYHPEKETFHIEVSDTGPGIPEEHRANVFDIFFTTKVVGQGTGLGLSISKNIIELHAGNIWFECPARGGTVFFIDLPREAMAPSNPDPVFIGMDEL